MKYVKSIFNQNFYVSLIAVVLGAGSVGFVLGVYFLPIIIASEGATEAQIVTAKENILARASFIRDLKGSDSLHWGDGELLISMEDGQVYATLDGEIAPGPDYKIYLTPKFVEDEDSFIAIKQDSHKVGDITGFKNFRTILTVSNELNNYAAVVIWCEVFKEFITAGRVQRVELSS